VNHSSKDLKLFSLDRGSARSDSLRISFMPVGFRVLLDFVYTTTFVLNVSNINDVYKASAALDFRHVQVCFWFDYWHDV